VPVLALGGAADPSGRVRALLDAAGTSRDALHADASAWQQAALTALRQPRELLAQRQQAITGHRSAPLFQTAAVVRHLQDALLGTTSPPRSAPKTTATREVSGTRATPRHPQERRDPSPA
jgi:hypothetical protein